MLEMISHSLHNHPRNECLSCVITKERSLAGLICRSIIYIFFVEQPSKDGSDILLSLVHSSLGENIWKPNAGFFSKLLVVNQFYFTQFFFAGFVFKKVRLSPQS